MDQYKIQDKLGDGTYGSVFKAVHMKTGDIVAIKRFKRKYPSWDECLQLKEVQVLKKLNHPNIIKLKEVLKVSDELNLVFEFLSKNLFEIYSECKKQGRTMEEARIRVIIRQVAEGLAYMHKHGYFHRDLKPENLLMLNETVKICDFGLAREIRSRPPYTDYVATRWYRAPEILLKQTNYNSPVDIFALGCIMAELYTFTPLFSGSSETDQLNKICKILGPPNQQNWPEGLKLANNLGFSFPYAQPVPLEKIIPTCSPDGIQLIVDMLKYDPTKRPSAQQILSYPYFQTQEIPKKLGIFENAKNTSDERVALPKKTNKFGDSTTDFLDFLDQKLNENEKTGDRNLENKPRYRQQVKKERKFDDPLSLLEEEKNNQKQNPFRIVKQNDSNQQRNIDDLERELAGILDDDKPMKRTNQFKLKLQNEQLHNSNLPSVNIDIKSQIPKPMSLMHTNFNKEQYPYQGRSSILPKIEANIINRKSEVPNYNDYSNYPLPQYGQANSKLPLYYQSKLQQNYGGGGRMNKFMNY